MKKFLMWLLCPVCRKCYKRFKKDKCIMDPEITSYTCCNMANYYYRFPPKIQL